MLPIGFTILSLLATLPSTQATPASPTLPSHCYIAQVGVIWDDTPNYRIHRVVIAGIREVEISLAASTPTSPTDTSTAALRATTSVTPTAAPNDPCTKQTTAAATTLRTAVQTRLDSIHPKRPLTKTFVDLRNPSLEAIQKELTRIATSAREHPGSFTRVEIVQSAKGTDATRDSLLPRFAKDDADARACAAANAQLAQSGAQFRWGC